MFRAFAGAVLLAGLLANGSPALRHRLILAESPRGTERGANALTGPNRTSPGLSWHDSRGDGFPDSARLDTAQDRENFTRWFTFLAETQYYAASPRTQAEIQDCAALVRYAFRNSLVAHSPAWREDAALPYDPGFGDVAKFHYPNGPLGRELFRARPGPVAPGDLEQGAFVEFADSATLLRYNAYLISRDVRAGRARRPAVLPPARAARAFPYHVVCRKVLLPAAGLGLDRLSHRRLGWPPGRDSRGAGEDVARTS